MIKNFHSNSARKPHSYGIILEKLGSGKNPKKYLICRRRDSYSYGVIIRGMWNDKTDLLRLLSLIEPEELERLRNHSFRELWDDYWTDHSSQAYTKDYEMLESYFDQVKKILVEDTIKTSDSRSSLWGFPKGRANADEDYMISALRECQEETRLDPAYITFKSDVFMKENILGTDYKTYCVTYFSAIYFGEESFPPPKYMGPRLREYSYSEEVSEIRWVTREEAMNILDYTKISLITDLENTLKDRLGNRHEYNHFKGKSTEKHTYSNSKAGGKYYNYAYNKRNNDHRGWFAPRAPSFGQPHL